MKINSLVLVDDIIVIGGEGNDTNTGNEGRDIFVCGDVGEQDTVTDYNEAEGDIATPDFKNV
jgi:hypothetical protein